MTPHFCRLYGSVMARAVWEGCLDPFTSRALLGIRYTNQLKHLVLCVSPNEEGRGAIGQLDHAADM